MVYGPFYLLLEAALLAADSEPTRGLRSWLRPHATSVNCLFPTTTSETPGTPLSSPAAGSPRRRRRRRRNRHAAARAPRPGRGGACMTPAPGRDAAHRAA